MFTCITPACGGSLSGPTGQFNSPNYPANYSYLTTCEWTVTVAVDYTIAFTFTDLKTEAYFDVIEVCVIVLSNE